MEESKTTSQYVYEDEYSFLTEKNELFLKEREHVSKRKLCKVDEETVETKVEELRKAFSDLEQRVEELEQSDETGDAQIQELKEELSGAKAIGNFDDLINRLNTIDATVKTQEEQEKLPGDEAVDGEETTVAEDESESTVSDADVEVEASETEAADASEEENEDENEKQSEDDGEQSAISFYKDILKKADNLIKQTDWSYVSMELDNLSREWGEGPDPESEEDREKVGKLYKKFTSRVDDFEQRKQEHYEKQKKQKKNNLERKKKILTQLKEVVDNEEWTATGKVNSIKNKWSSVGQLPSGEGEDLDQKFKELIDTFNDHKVDRLVQQRQKEEDNLMLKLIVLDKMEYIANSIDESTKAWKAIDEKFDDLTKQWKKIGRVPKEKSNDVWSRYKSAQDTFYDNKYEFDKKHRSRVDKYRSKKEKIINEAETLLEEEDLATAARKINKLHRRWKKAGNLPQRLEDELWSRFKSATDAFNERKSKHSDKIQEQEEQHYQEKLKLIEQAEAIKDTTDWDKGHQQMQSLMDKWKAIGPVPRKKSNKIWKKFKGAMDVFYDRRREHFKEVKEERKDNLEEKEEILKELKELGQHEDPIEAVNIAKKLQAKFKDAGYVPIKKKNKIWKQYREACDVIYDRFRAAKSGNKFDQELAKADLDSKDRSKIQSMRKEYKKIEKEVRQLEEEVIKYQETKTYFKPSKKGNSLLDEVEQKIEHAEEKLQDKQDKLDSITREMEEIRDEA